MSNYGTVIFSDMQMDEPRHLCLRENGDLYTFTIGKIDDQFFEKNVEIVTEKEAMIFVANASTKARNAILSKTIQN